MVTGLVGSIALVWWAICLKYSSAWGNWVLGSLAKDHMITEGRFLSLRMSSDSESLWRESNDGE